MSKQDKVTGKQIFFFLLMLSVYMLIISVQYYRITHFLAEGSTIRVYREIIVSFIGLGGLTYAVWIKWRDDI